MASVRPETGKKGASAPSTIGTAGRVDGRAVKSDCAIVAGLAVIAVVALWPVISCDFVNYDDPWYVTGSLHVQQGLTLANLGWAFAQTAGYWVPIDTLSHMLDCQLFGMNAAGHHAANLAYHVCNTMLLFLLLRRMTGQRWCSALVAGLFALHPQNVEPVAWIASRKDVLSTLLGLLALLAYVRYAARTGLSRYVPVVVLLTLSLMVKPALAPFPVLLLFLDYWPLRRMEDLKFGSEEGRRRCYRLVLEKVPLFAVVCGFVALSYATQSRLGSLKSSEAYPFATRVANAATSYVTYVWDVFWPTHLAACYPYPTFVWWKTAGALMLLAILTAAAFLGRKRFPSLFVGWFWYLLALAPASGLGAQIGNMPRSDRFAYVPTIGLFIAMAWALGAVARRWRQTSVAIPIAALAALTVLAVAAHVQVRYWSDSATLFRHALDVTQGNHMAYSFLGKTFADQGRDEEAIAAFTEALRLAPHFSDAHNNLGNVLCRRGQSAEAVAHFAEALRWRPQDETILYNMGLALLAQDKYDEAIAYFRRAIAAKPDFPMARNNLGYALACKGAFAEAVVEYREALRAEPRSALVLFNMGDALLALDKYAEAIQCYDHAAEADPQQCHEAFNRIGDTLVRQGKNDEAIAFFRKAIAAKPDFALAHNNLGRELARKGGLEQAIAEYREALRTAPESTLVLNNLGDVLVDMGQPNEAANVFRKAIEIDPQSVTARLNLGRLFASQQRYADACKQFSEAAKIAPQNTDARKALEAARRAMQTRGN